MLKNNLKFVNFIKGAGGLHQDFIEFDFLVVSETFYQIKNCIACAIFNSHAIELENLSSPTVFEQSP